MKRTTQETSIKARKEIAAKIPTMLDKILDIVGNCGSDGITSDELVTKHGFIIQTASARIRELCEDNQIRKSDKRRKTSSGKTAIVWVKN